jgi:Cu-Zn family superoxide dismutase
MMSRIARSLAVLPLVLAPLALTGCESMPFGRSAASAHHLVCTLSGTAGNEGVRGVVHFVQEGDAVLIEADVSGLTPGRHGFHIHEWGDTSCDDGTCTGGHFNPGNTLHGAPEAGERHAGDLGNLEADRTGRAIYRRVDHVVSLHGPNSILGRGLIVHAGEDDFRTQPTGNAGARVAAGVIGLAPYPQ